MSNTADLYLSYYSDTPRVQEYLDRTKGTMLGPHKVMADFAQGLERELNEANKKVEALKFEIEEHQNNHNRYGMAEMWYETALWKHID